MIGLIQLLIVDDHALFRDSIARLLMHEQGMAVAGVCGTTAEAKRILRLSPVSVILLDYDLGNELGTEMIAYLAMHHPEIRVLLVTGGMSASVSRNAVKIGVAGVVLKHSSPVQLIQAVRQVAEGGSWWDQSVVEALAQPATEAVAFSERQSQILNLLLEGLSNKELASRLLVSESAIKASLQELFRKTGVRTRSQLVRISIEAGSAKD